MTSETHASNGESQPQVERQPSESAAPVKPASRVAVVVPSANSVSVHTAKWLSRQQLLPGVQASYLVHHANGYVEDMRQALAELYLEKSLAPWLLMVDSDTIPKLDALQIVSGAEEAGCDIVVGPTLMKPEPGKGVCSNIKVSQGPKATFLPWSKVPWGQDARYWQIYLAGFACTLIRRSVLVRLLDDARRGRAEWPFKATWVRGRMILSEDLSFFVKADRAGYKIFADLDNPCAHAKSWMLTPQDYWDYQSFAGGEVNEDAPRPVPEGYEVKPQNFQPTLVPAPPSPAAH